MSFQWLRGKDKGWFRETRVSRFEPNMGGEAAPVKSPDIEEACLGYDFISKKL
jgi:hypothetical protein